MLASMQVTAAAADMSNTPTSGKQLAMGMVPKGPVNCTELLKSVALKAHRSEPDSERVTAATVEDGLIQTIRDVFANDTDMVEILDAIPSDLFKIKIDYSTGTASASDEHCVVTASLVFPYEIVQIVLPFNWEGKPQGRAEIRYVSYISGQDVLLGLLVSGDI